MSLTDTNIHPTAVVAEGAVLGPGVMVGPYCVIGPEVRLAANVTLKSHVVVDGDTKIGEGTVIFPFASIGGVPQDLKFRGETSRLRIGANNTIRESVTMNPGTEGGGMVTRVGDGNLFMVNVHVAHDCQVGDGNVFANNVSLAGHVIVEDNVVIGGHAGVHQFVRIGRGAMVGVLSAVLADVIPYGTVTGDAAKLGGLNLVGLKRRGASKDEMNGLRAAFKTLFGETGTLKERAEAVKGEFTGNRLVDTVTAFILSESDRSFCQPGS